MQLRCIDDYRAGDVRYEPGQVIDVKDGVGQFLLRDAPGSFELVGARRRLTLRARSESAPNRMHTGGRKRA